MTKFAWRPYGSEWITGGVLPIGALDTSWPRFTTGIVNLAAFLTYMNSVGESLLDFWPDPCLLNCGALSCIKVWLMANGRRWHRGDETTVQSGVELVPLRLRWPAAVTVGTCAEWLLPTE